MRGLLFLAVVFVAVFTVESASIRKKRFLDEESFQDLARRFSGFLDALQAELPNIESELEGLGEDAGEMVDESVEYVREAAARLQEDLKEIDFGFLERLLCLGYDCEGSDESTPSTPETPEEMTTVVVKSNE